MNDVFSIGRAALYFYTGGRWSFRQQMTSSNVTTNLGMKYGLFSDDDNVYGLFPNDTTNGFRLIQFPPGTDDLIAIGNELTSTALHPDLRSGGSDYNDAARFWIHKQQDSNGDTEITLYVSSTGTDMTPYRWNGPSDVMTVLPNGGGTYAFPDDDRGGGSRTYAVDEPTIAIYARERNATGQLITFRCFGGQIDQTVRIYQGSGGEAPLTQSTLVAGSAEGGVAVVSGSQIINVDCDGTTDYQVAIAATEFEDFDRIELVGSVSAA